MEAERVVLTNALEKAMVGATNPWERGRLSTQAYIGFALKNPHAYRIMFDIDAPIDESHPELGQQAERAARYITAGAEKLAEAGLIDLDPQLFGYTMWAALHGIVMLHQSGMLKHGPDYKALAQFQGMLAMRGAMAGSNTTKKSAAKSRSGK